MLSRGLILFVTVVEGVIVLAHFIAYATISFILSPMGTPPMALFVAFVFLSFFFVIATLLSMRGFTAFTSAIYRASAVWMGTLSLLVFASIVFWLIWNVLQFFGGAIDPRLVGLPLIGAALLLSIWGVYRSYDTKVVRYTVSLPNLPDAWIGRRAVVASDTHFGPVRSAASAQKLVSLIRAQAPDIIFLPGDLFDGPPADYPGLTRALSNLHAPLGIFFSEGNHEEFRDPTNYQRTLRDANITMLDNQVITIDGLTMLGLSFIDSTAPVILKEKLTALPFDRTKPSILLKHAPTVPEIVRDAGISLMLSGHTHLGQMWPYSIIGRRMIGPAGYGHAHYGTLQTTTTSGFGTWGPPQRLGTQSEIVVIEFKKG